MIQEEPTEQKESGHHGERRCVVWKCGLDESLVLVVTERSDRGAGDGCEESVPTSDVLDLEREDPIYVRNFEGGGVSTALVVFEIDANVRVQHSELQLNIFRQIGDPLLAVPLLNLDGIFDILLDGVGEGAGSLTDSVVLHIDGPENTPLLEQPFHQLSGKVLISRFWGTLAVPFGGILLNRRREIAVAEQLQRTGKYDPSIVPRLESRDQADLLSGNAEFFDLLVRRVRIGGGRGAQDAEQQGRILFDILPNPFEEDRGIDLLWEDDRGIDDVGRIGDDNVVRSIEIRRVEIQVIQNESALLVELDIAITGNR